MLWVTRCLKNIRILCLKVWSGQLSKFSLFIKIYVLIVISVFSPVFSVSFIISLPFAIYFRTMEREHPEPNGEVVTLTHCEDVWPEPQETYHKTSIIVVVLSTYVVPLSVIIYCYAMILSTLWKNKMTFGVGRQLDFQRLIHQSLWDANK